MTDTVEFIDTTLRDGQQSLWGMRMRAGHITGAADDIHNTGYHVIDLTGGAQWTCMMRYLREDPFEWMTHVTGLFPGATLRAGMRPSSSGNFGVSALSILDLKTEMMIKYGISSFWIYDCLFDMPAVEYAARKAKELGAKEVCGALLYGISPVHTDEFYADKVRQMVSWGPGVIDAIYLEDAPGILLPERTATLVPALMEAAQGLPIEIHCHNTVGMAPLNYAEAIRQGVRIVHTCSRPLANGPSLPSVDQTARNVEALGYSHRLDTSRLEPVAEHFHKVTVQEGHELGVPAEWDASLYLHQLPGGMMGTFKAQLVQHNMEDRLPDVLEEIVKVREDFGHPISATPFSQLIGTQAVLNVITGERYSVTTDEVIMYVYGHMGQTPAPVDQDMKDRVTDSPRGRELANYTRPETTLEEMRVQYGGAHLSNEELMRRFYAPIEDVEATKAAGPLKKDFDFDSDLDLMGLVDKAVHTSSRARRISLRTRDVSVSLSR